MISNISMKESLGDIMWLEMQSGTMSQGIDNEISFALHGPFEMALDKVGCRN